MHDRCYKAPFAGQQVVSKHVGDDERKPTTEEQHEPIRVGRLFLQRVGKG